MLLSSRASSLRGAPASRPASDSSSSSTTIGVAVAASAAARRRCRSLIAASSAASDAAATTTTTTQTYTRATLRTTDACELAVSVYPFFRYKAAGGGGDATVAAADDAPSSSTLNLSFDASTLRIPALDFRTAFLFGLVPIPPPLRIAIEPRELSGTFDPTTGACDLTFDAEFCFSAGPLYKAPPLRVQTVLTTSTSTGARLSGQGRRWDKSTSSVRLAGVARVPKTGDAFLDAFLMLPNDALAVLEGELELR
jgi:hypothetical protein